MRWPMSTVSEPTVVRPRPTPRLMLPPAPVAAPRGRARWVRLPWLLGLILLTVSLVGASQVLHSRQTEATGQAKPVPDRAAAVGHGVWCLGTVACDGGVPPEGLALYPAAQGVVTEILAAEGLNV